MNRDPTESRRQRYSPIWTIFPPAGTTVRVLCRMKKRKGSTVMGSRSGMLALGALQRELPLGGHEARDPQLGIHGGCRLPVLQASSPFLLSSPSTRQTAGTTNQKLIKKYLFCIWWWFFLFLCRKVFPPLVIKEGKPANLEVVGTTGQKVRPEELSFCFGFGLLLILHSSNFT